MVTGFRINRTEDRKAIHHRGLFRQMFADDDAGKFGGNHSKGAAILRRPIRFRIPCVDLTGAPRHPEQDHTFPLGGTEPSAVDRFPRLQQLRQRQACHPEDTRFEQITSASDGQAFGDQRVQIAKCVRMRIFGRFHEWRSSHRFSFKKRSNA